VLNEDGYDADAVVISMPTYFLTDSTLQSLSYLMCSHEFFYETKLSLSPVKATFAYFSASFQLGS